MRDRTPTHGLTYIWGSLFFITFFIPQIGISWTFELPIFYAYVPLCLLLILFLVPF